MYEVKIENNLSKIITTMTVMAEDEQQARENVSLNGWSVIGVRLLKERVKETQQQVKHQNNRTFCNIIRVTAKELTCD